MKWGPMCRGIARGFFPAAIDPQAQTGIARARGYEVIAAGAPVHLRECFLACSQNQLSSS
eukprot:COSAG02_NODE_20307_length_838_cov_1.527740_1_plen_60_part_00